MIGSRRRSASSSEVSPRNLLEYRSIGALARWRFFPAVFQWLTTVVFAIVVWQLLLGPRTASDNFGTAMVWVVWWPLLPLTFLALGRVWCAVCPFGWLSDQVQKVVGVERRAPKFLKKYGIWIIDALFILITWGDHAMGIVESPWGSGVLLAMVITAVVASGAFFERRTFCRYVCFLGGVAGNYSRAGMVALRANRDICAKCKAKAACFNGTASTPPCPVFEFPRTMDNSAGCVLCANCVKSCPNDAIAVTVRRPTKELWSMVKPRMEGAFLAVAIMGIVFVQNITMLSFWPGVVTWISGVLGTDSDAVIYAVVFTVAIASTAGLLLLASSAASRVNGVASWKNFARFGYAVIPLDVAGHVAHNLFHLLAEGKSVLVTAGALVGVHSNGVSPALVGSQTIQVLQYVIVALGTFGSLLVVWKMAGRPAVARARRFGQFLPYAALIVLFAAINVVLFAIPMAHRM